MKQNIHPTWYPEAKVTCICGNTFTVGSTKPEITVDICANCHPFFTGEMKLIDTAGMVERYEAKKLKAAPVVVNKKERRYQKKLAEELAEAKRPKSLKEMFGKSE